jgi:hypothetical protein
VKCGAYGKLPSKVASDWIMNVSCSEARYAEHPVSN